MSEDIDHNDGPDALIDIEAWNRESSEIRGLVNPGAWRNWQDNNKDPYGRACVKIARKVMEYLDGTEPFEYNIGYKPDMTTPHGIICHVDDEGITGFMAGMVRNMVAVCYRDGWKFFLADVISPYDVDDLQKIDRHIATVVDGDLGVKEDEVRRWTADLIDRWKEANPEGPETP